MSKTQKTSVRKSGKNIYDRFSEFLSTNRNYYIILLAGIVLSLMNFNARISEAHDDSLYIEAAYRYVHEFPNYFYTANAPMYSMFLALLTLIFGTNLILFKFFSVLFYVGGAILIYKALDKKVPEILKFFVFIFVCINYYIIYYSSQTFSESFYMLIQSAFFYYFSKYNFGDDPISDDIRKDYKKWLTLGLWMMLLTLAKNILLFGIAAIILFYILRKEYKKAGIALVSFGVFKGLYEFIKSLVWGASGVQYSSQMSILLNKDPYDASKGQEDMAGFIGRFTDNIGLYLGKRFYQILGFMDERHTFTETVEINGEYVNQQQPAEYFLAFIVLFLTFFGLYKAVKNKQNAVAFFVLFAGSISFGTFFVLQARWDQTRLIMVHMPALLLGIGYGLYKLLEKDNFNQRLFLTACALVVASMLISTAKRGTKNIPILSKNLSGDIYYGYTPDLENYLKLSAWCADSLPENSNIACRKAPMSFVYGKGKHFFPIYSVIAKDPQTNQSNPDSALAIFKKNHVTHIMLASLRLDPARNTGQFINTLHNIAYPIAQKYPDKLRLVKTIGDAEEASLYEIRY